MDFRKAEKASEGVLKRSTVTGRNVQWERMEMRSGEKGRDLNFKVREYVRDVDR
jgi:hypothetical protein